MAYLAFLFGARHGICTSSFKDIGTRKIPSKRMYVHLCPLLHSLDVSKIRMASPLGHKRAQIIWFYETHISDLSSFIISWQKKIFFCYSFRCTDVPVLNQIEFNPYCVDQDILEYCRENKIIVQAYSPLGSDPGRNAAKNQTRVLEHETMVNIFQILFISNYESLLGQSKNYQHKK